MKNQNILVAALTLILVAIASRLIPHPWNWTAMGATAILAGVHIRNPFVALLVPFGALAVTDLLIGFHNTAFFTWGAFGLITFASLKGKSLFKGFLPITTITLSGTIFFYLFTNFGYWLTSGFYPMNLAGLLAAYIAGLPFLFSQSLGDLFYVGLLHFVLSKSYTQVPSLIHK